MKMNVLVRFLAAMSVLYSIHSMALPEMNPYRGLVLAEQKSEASLREEALTQVLIKVSGNVDIMTLDESKNLMGNIRSMLSQFGYQNIAGDRFYYALFDESKINTALNNMQQPIWGETRPSPLIWLVNEKRQIVSENMIADRQDKDVSWGLKKAELKRGIEAKFPILDLDESLVIRSSDITGRFHQIVADASTRYGAEYVVLANLYKLRSGQWSLRWELVQYDPDSYRKQLINKRITGDEKAEVMAKMLNDIADYYAQKFAIFENNGEKLTQVLTFNDINSLAGLTQLNKVLAGLNAVERFKVMEINEHQVNVLVTLKGGLMSLENALNAQPELEADSTAGSYFQYNWQQ
jgi:hypothetical protein